MRRFWSKVKTTRGWGCWLWTGATNHFKHGAGYGRFHRSGRGGRFEVAHRVAYEMLVGKIPAGMTLDHLCRVRNCVRPSHLELVSFRENVLRGRAPTAINARKSHCHRGHPLIGGNLIPYKLAKGKRECRECHRIHNRRHRSEK